MSAHIAVSGQFGQLDSRLWDVGPDGKQTLISRGIYRLRDVPGPEPLDGLVRRFHVKVPAWHGYPPLNGPRSELSLSPRIGGLRPPCARMRTLSRRFGRVAAGLDEAYEQRSGFLVFLDVAGRCDGLDWRAAHVAGLLPEQEDYLRRAGLRLA